MSDVETPQPDEDSGNGDTPFSPEPQEGGDYPAGDDDAS